MKYRQFYQCVLYTPRSAIRIAAPLFLLSLLLLAALPAQAQPQEMNDSELSQVSGQALFEMQKVTENGFTFYTIGIDATIDLNTNIQKMQLGCNGINGLGNCDINASNVSFGCASNDGVNCYTPASSCNNPAICTATTGASPNTLLPFILNNPFLQIAVQNDGSANQRTVAGFRMGAASVSGPMSIGTMSSFSGYLNAIANLTLQAQSDVAVTCGPTTGPCTGTAQPTCSAFPFPCAVSGSYSSNGVNQFGYNSPTQSLNLKDDAACTLGGLVCAAFDAITVNVPSIARTNLPVEGSGNRITQGFVEDATLGDAVASLTAGLTVNQSKGAIPPALLNLALGLITPAAENAIDTQLAIAFGLSLSCLPSSCSTATLQAALNAYNMPINLANLHQIIVQPNSPFGISFENQPIAYPGYVNASGAAQTVPTGWAMYLANATTLNVTSPTTLFVSNVSNGSARAGNVLGLPGPYQNCYGTATFC